MNRPQSAGVPFEEPDLNGTSPDILERENLSDKL
jgi:hypothetical protein